MEEGCGSSTDSDQTRISQRSVVWCGCGAVGLRAKGCRLVWFVWFSGPLAHTIFARPRAMFCQYQRQGTSDCFRGALSVANSLCALGTQGQRARGGAHIQRSSVSHCVYSVADYRRESWGQAARASSPAHGETGLDVAPRRDSVVRDYTVMLESSTPSCVLEYADLEEVRRASLFDENDEGMAETWMYVPLPHCRQTLNMGGVLVRRACAVHLFLTIPHPCLFLPPLTKQPGQFWLTCCGSFVI